MFSLYCNLFRDPGSEVVRRPRKLGVSTLSRQRTEFVFLEFFSQLRRTLTQTRQNPHSARATDSLEQKTRPYFEKEMRKNNWQDI